VAILAILYGPLLILVLFSFNNSIVIALPLRGFTLEWYREMLTDNTVIAALRNSLTVAAVVMPICLILGTLSAYGITRFRFRLRGPAAGLIGGPLVIPWLLTGVGALLFFNRFNIPLSLNTIGVMHVVIIFPLVTAIISARLIRFEPSIEEAALDLGATPRQVLRFIVLPILAPTVAACAIFAFSWSFNNFTISFFTGGFDPTFPIWVYSTLVHARNVPVVNAISTVVSVVEVTAVYAAWRLSRSRAEGSRYRRALAQLLSRDR
jgi:spermidine/putrescine transport system permease protein